MSSEDIIVHFPTTFHGGGLVAAVVVGFLLILRLISIRPTSDEKVETPPPQYAPIPTMPIGAYTFTKAAATGILADSYLKWYRDHEDDLGEIFHFNNLTYLFSKKKSVAIINPTLIRKVLKSPHVHKAEKVYARLKPLHDLSMETFFTANGHRWSHARKALNVAFSSSHIKRMRSVTVEKVEDFMKKLDALERNGESFDVGKEMVSLTLKVICDAAFEYKMEDEEQEQFITNLSMVLQESAKGAIPLRWKLGSFIPAVRAARDASRDMEALAIKILDHYRNLENPTPDTVIDRIAKNTSYASDRERAADIVVLLFAGHDTTAYSIAFTLIELAKHPEEQEKLRNDLLSVMKSGEGSPSKLLEDCFHSASLSNVIKEGMRLNHVAPTGGYRRSSKDIVDEESNIMIPKDTMMNIPVILLLRNARFFPDPDSFRPSRWECISKDAEQAFIPFMVGRRNCVGQSLANAEMKTVLSMLCARYDITLEEEGTKTWFLTYKPVGFRLRARKL